MPPEPKPGRVRLVGAGPGAADLLTVRALKAIEGAEALLYDALISDEVLALAPAHCLKMQTGKRAGRTSMAQSTINRLMLRLARRGLTVVRLKGGDPSIFGRVGEEREFLMGHGVEVEIVPGVTAASAAAAQFGFPLTHRGEARRLLISTGTVTSGAALEEGWLAAADRQTTLALYMGRDQAGAVAAQLIGHGRSPVTPAVAVENAGSEHARAIASTLRDLAGDLAAAAPTGPVVLLIGDVAARADIAAAQESPVVSDLRMFAFESDFVASLRCVPMAVRLKLDLCGIKLSLRQWSRFTRDDRHGLLVRPCGAGREAIVYREALVALIALRTGEAAKALAETPCGQWDNPHSVPEVVADYARSVGLSPPCLRQWAALSRLQRFALIKLTRDNHDNVNFAPAMIEFGLGPGALEIRRAELR